MSASASCSGCGKRIVTLEFMECCKCKKLYDLACLNITHTTFSSYDTHFKDRWLCPLCPLPKGDNSGTPVRSTSGSGFNTTFTPKDTINMTRGSRARAQINSEIVKNYNPESEIHQPKAKIQELSTTNKCKCIDQNDIRNIIREELQSFFGGPFVSSFVSEIVQQMTVSKLTIQKPSDQPNCNLSPKQKECSIEAAQTEQQPLKPASRQKSKAVPPASPSAPLQGKPSQDRDFAKRTLSTRSKPTVSPPDTIVNLERSAAVEDPVTNSDWVKVGHKNNERPARLSRDVLRGTAAPGATMLHAAERRRYLHLFYVREGTTEEQVRAHLVNICGEDVCTVEALKPRGHYASFKLDVPSKLSESVMAPSNWAQDICIKPWRQNFRVKQKSETN
ncbi:unnamed protein product [Colias eurytheme]|nr:unnamed protein product [Colias eurytheme]